MSEIIIPMSEVENCLICNKHIGEGNDPAVCDDPHCLNMVILEWEFNRVAKEDVRKSAGRLFDTEKSH